MDDVARRGTPLSADLQAAVIAVAKQSGIRACAKLLRVHRTTVQKYLRSSKGETPAGRREQPPAQGQKGSAS
jgi:hypothetical protein